MTRRRPFLSLFKATRAYIYTYALTIEVTESSP